MTMHHHTGLVKQWRKLKRWAGNCYNIHRTVHDLAPSDFHLFGPLKESLGGIKFDNNEDVQQHVLQFLHAADKDFYAAGFNKLVERWEHCIELQGDYVEK